MSSRILRVLTLLFAALSGALMAQQEKLPLLTPPTAPAAAPAPPVAPPMPGQLQAAPAAAPSRIPDLPVKPAVVPPTTLSSNKGIHSTSSSGQFIVHGNDLPLRSAFSSRCEEIHAELRQLLHDQQPWALPVVVLLNSGESARKADKAVSMTLSEITHGGFHIQVTVNLRPDLRPSDFRSEIVRALLAERVLRHQKGGAKRASILPDWIFTGVMEALDYRKQARPSTLFAAIFKSGKIFGIEEIIEASPTQMDALSRTIYQTSCCALVLALLDQPEGGARLNRFLSSIAGDARPERELLDQAFPSFATSPASLNKWWALQLASLSRPGVSEPLSPDATLAALEDALIIHYQSRAIDVPQPRVRPVIAKVKLTPSQPATVSTPKPDAETPPALVSEATLTDEKKRGFFRWLNPFSHRKTDEESMIESAIEDAAKEEAKSRVEEESNSVDKPAEVAANITLPEAEGPRMEAGEERKPVLNRWFGTGRKKPAAETANAAEKPEAAPKSNGKPVVEEALPAPAEETEKRSKLNPLNWFRGDKKKAEEDPSKIEEPAKQKSEGVSNEQAGEKAAASVPSLQQDWQLTQGQPLVAMVFQEAAVSEDAPKQKKRLFGIFGNGKKPAEEPKKEPAAEPKKEESKPAPKKEAREESKEKAKPSEPKPEPASEKKPDTKKPAEAPPPAAEMPPAEVVKFAEPATSPEKPRRGLRGLFGGDKKTEDPKTAPTDEPAKPEPMAAEAKPPVAEKPVDKPKEVSDTAPKPATPPPAAEMSAEVKPAAEGDKANHQPMRIRPLFGSGKKKEEGLMPDEKPAEAPKSEPMTTETRPETDKPKPKAVAKEDAKPEKPKSEPAPEPKTEDPQMPVAKQEEAKPKPATPAKKPEDTEPTVAAAVPIEDYAAILKRPDRKQILQRNLMALTALQQRSAVLFRPIVVEYTSLVSELIDGKTKNVDERLLKLRERTQDALDQSKAIRDQLDLHEANSSPAMSGAFEDYLRLPETIQGELPPRQDAISKYLDSLDREFSKQ
ncbi:MAG: hypothetical protein V4662_24260 [Verrucomicrobiota bacterium]